ncbi:MAG TPA: cytochrome c [Opitutaceae bacterium]|nr:cytochrome c [Opitutaceae bacterium]
MRYVYLVFGLLLILAVSLAGFRGAKFTRPPIEIFDDMDRQLKVKAQAVSPFFADGRADRPTPANTVARGHLDADDALFRGRDANAEFVAGYPESLTIDETLVRRGQNRYMIYCAPCHGAVGDGNGITKSYGMGATVTLLDERLRTMVSGEIFNTITNGKNTMRPYGDKLDAQDRWAVVAYVRALQRASHASAADVPESAKAELGLK